MEHINSLHACAGTSSKKSKIGRPINCFMAFRSEKHQEIASLDPKLNNRDISKIIAKWWKKLSEEEKAPYRAIAMKAKAEHELRYPNYTYRPIKKSQRRVRPYHRREDAITRVRKAQKNELRLKPWLGEGDDTVPGLSPSPTTAAVTPTFQDVSTSSISSTDYTNISMDFNLFSFITPTHMDDLFSPDLFSSCDSMYNDACPQPPLPLFDLDTCFFPESDPLFSMPMDLTAWTPSVNAPLPPTAPTPDFLSLENFLQC